MSDNTSDKVISINTEENRFSRFELIRWWDQKRLSNAKILVIGAGALGNEIIKNLALLGIGNIIVVDFDKIEPSNLSRSVLFRERDRGRFKAEVAAERAKDLYPDLKIKPLCINAVADLGLGLYDWADVILGGLDNREARLSINRNSFAVGKTWIDGAIEVLSGVARVFSPDGPCYECTMGEVDWKILQARKSCTLLSRNEMLSGKTPTTPTIASLIASIQCQEALKILHGMESINGKGFIYDGINFYHDLIAYKRKEECYSHESFLPLIKINNSAAQTTLEDALNIIKKDMGQEAELELREEVITGFSCGNCFTTEEFHASVGKVTESDSICPKCKKPRFPILTHRFDGSEEYKNKTLSELGIPYFDVIIGHCGEQRKYFLLDGDRDSILEDLDK